MAAIPAAAALLPDLVPGNCHLYRRIYYIEIFTKLNKPAQVSGASGGSEAAARVALHSKWTRENSLAWSGAFGNRLGVALWWALGKGLVALSRVLGERARCCLEWG